MPSLDSTKKNYAERAKFAADTPTASCDGPGPNPADYQVLYVLGFGIAGAIVANMTLFVYFVTVYYASG